jgi:hypothetical protein
MSKEVPGLFVMLDDVSDDKTVVSSIVDKGSTCPVTGVV